ncbi:MAG: sodium/proton-translocating pyrophosphatase [Myxococcota bacterium]
MIALLLIVTVASLGLGVAATTYRWVASRPVGEGEVVRLSRLVFEGGVGYLRRQSVVVTALAGVVAALVLVGFGVAYQLQGASSARALTVDAAEAGLRARGLWATGSFLLGALGATMTGWLAFATNRVSCARLVAGTRASLDEALQVALRAGAVTGVFTLALALLGLGLTFGLAWAVQGGWSDSAGAGVASLQLPELVGGFALGASAVALFGQVSGGTFGDVADLGADVGGKLEAALGPDDRDNPATLADLAGDHFGEGTSRAMVVFAAIALELVVAMRVGAEVYRSNPDLVSVTAVVLLPPVVHAFGLFGAFFGVAVMRTDDTEVPMTALSRGLHITLVLAGIGGVGATKWLVDPHWMVFGGCWLSGLLGGAGLLYTTQYYSESRFRPVRTIAEAARGGATLAALRGWASAGEGTAVTLAVATMTSTAAFALGAQSGLVHGGLFGMVLAVAGLFGAMPYVLAMSSLGVVADTAGGLIDLSPLRRRVDVRARARLLDAVGTTSKSYARTLLAVGSGVSCLLALTTFSSRSGSDAGLGLPAPSPVVGVAVVAGVATLLLFAWMLLRGVVAAARDVVQELRAVPRVPDHEREDGGVEDQSTLSASAANRGTTREEGVTGRERRQVACVEIVARAALRGLIPPAVVGLGAPLVIVAGLRATPTGDTVRSSLTAIVAFLFAATAASTLGILLGNQAGTAWDNAKKYIETGAHGGRFALDPTRSGTERSATERHNPTYVAAIINDTTGDPLKGVVSSAVQALILTLTALAFVISPLFW